MYVYIINSIKFKCTCTRKSTWGHADDADADAMNMCKSTWGHADDADAVNMCISLHGAMQMMQMQ